MDSINHAVDLVNAVRKGEKTVEQFHTDINLQKNPQIMSTELFSASLEGKILENNSILGNKYLEQFNRTRNQVLRIKDNIEVFTEEESKAAVEAFSMSWDASNSSVALNGSIATNISALQDKYFYDSAILSRVSKMDEGADKEEITDITNTRAGETKGENDDHTPTNETTVVDTLKPAQNGVITDSIELSRSLYELNSPVNMATMLARMERTVRNIADAKIVGVKGNDTDGTEEFYSILNSKASSGTNRGSLAVTVLDTGVVDNVDAVNYVIGQLPINSLDELNNPSMVVAGNWATLVKLMRTRNANADYFYDPATKTIRSLFINAPMIIVPTMANDDIGVWDLANYKYKQVKAPSNVLIAERKGFFLARELQADGTPTMAYKATPTKNGFRHFTLLADYTT